MAIGKVTFSSRGRHALTLRLTKAGRAKLRHARRASLRLRLVVRDAAGNAVSSAHALSAAQ